MVSCGVIAKLVLDLRSSQLWFIALFYRTASSAATEFPQKSSRPGPFLNWGNHPSTDGLLTTATTISTDLSLLTNE
jgi:hypothetical protein